MGARPAAPGPREPPLAHARRRRDPVRGRCAARCPARSGRVPRPSCRSGSRPPPRQGDHLLEIDLVHEHVRWFEAPLTVPVVVAERRPLAETPGPGAWRRADRDGRRAQLPAPGPGPGPDVPGSPPRWSGRRARPRRTGGGAARRRAVRGRRPRRPLPTRPAARAAPHDRHLQRDGARHRARSRSCSATCWRAGAPSVTYLDPDVEVFAAIDDVAGAAERHGIVLTPHRLTRSRPTGASPTSGRSSCRAPTTSGSSPWGRPGRGSSTGGLTAAVATASSTCPTGSSSTSGGSTWPSPTSHHTCVRDPGLNVAYWNLDERPIEPTPGGGSPGRRCAAAVPPLQRLRPRRRTPAHPLPRGAAARAAVRGSGAPRRCARATASGCGPRAGTSAASSTTASPSPPTAWCSTG